MKNRFSHSLLGTVFETGVGSELRSACGARSLKITTSDLQDVASLLEPGREPKFELRVRVYPGKFYRTEGRAKAIDNVDGLAAGAARRAGRVSRSHHRHGFSWHTCDEVLALRDGDFLRVFGPSVAALQPWFEECAALRAPCFFPVLRAAGQTPDAPESTWNEFCDVYKGRTARALLAEEAIHLDLPLPREERLRQTVVGFLCAAVDPTAATIALSPRGKEAASHWLCRRHDPNDPARLASWVWDNGCTEALANAAEDVEASFGGLYSVDRAPYFGGMQILEGVLSPGSVADWPLQETPGGTALIVSRWDIDNRDALVGITEDGSLWVCSLSWDEWERTSDSARTFVSRIATWGHLDEGTVVIARASHGRALARELDLREVEEATDSTGTFYAGEAALVFERRWPERAVTRMRALRPEAMLAWDELTELADRGAPTPTSSTKRQARGRRTR